MSSAGPSQELPVSKDSVAPRLRGAIWGRIPHPSGGPAASTSFPKGLTGSRTLAAASPGPRWGASLPSTTAQQLDPGRPAAGPPAPALGAGLEPGLPPAGLPGGRADPREGARQPLCTAVSLCVSACTGVSASIVGKGGGGTLLFARLFPNMAPLLRTQEKKIQWFYQNKLLLVPETAFVNAGLVPTPGRWGRHISSSCWL